jgi:diadenosine tetraphosphatase ApaH/serine/threonine PP2A family protein phosphatase
MATVAILSDIHGNLEALNAVLADAKAKKIKETICLGDTVGYGADPVKCADIARKFSVNLMGNHEWAILNEPLGFNASARRALNWAKARLIPRWYSLGRTVRRWRFLKRLQKSYKRDSFLFVHGSPRNPFEEYIMRYDVDEVLRGYNQKVKECFSLTDWVTFVGHSHIPGIITEDAFYFEPAKIDSRFKLEKGKKYIVNVGSVGQPRDRNWRSCYVTLDVENAEVAYHRIEYDVQKAAEKIRRIGEMDESLSTRITLGT